MGNLKYFSFLFSNFKWKMEGGYYLLGERFADSHEGDTLEKKKLVQVDFYGESLCPDCQHMVLDILAPMFDNGIADFMNLTYIAYGNVKENVQDDGKIQCQHGPVECRFNRYINCAQNEKHNQKDWYVVSVSIMEFCLFYCFLVCSYIYIIAFSE